jgi:hypothetical protein
MMPGGEGAARRDSRGGKIVRGRRVTVFLPKISEHASWITTDNAIRLHVLRHNGVRRDHRACADRNPLKN